MGEQLLVRSRQGVRPTKIGSQVLKEIDHIERHISRISQLSNQPVDFIEGKVKTSILTSALTHALSKALGDFQVKYPAIEIEILSEKESVYTKRLINNQIDFAIDAGTAVKKSLINTYQVRSFPRHLWISGHHEKSDANEFDADSLKDEIIYVYDGDNEFIEFREYIETLEKIGLNIQWIGAVGAVRSLVEANMGMCILSDLSYVSENMGSKNVYVKQLYPTPPPFSLCLYSSMIHKPSVPAQRLQTFLIDYIKKTPVPEIL